MTEKERLFLLLEKNDPNTRVVAFCIESMSSQDVQRLATIIKNNTYLETLRLLECDLQASDIPLIAMAMDQNNTIMEVVIQSYHDDTPQTKALIQAIIDRAEHNRSTQNAPTPKI